MCSCWENKPLDTRSGTVQFGFNSFDAGPIESPRNGWPPKVGNGRQSAQKTKQRVTRWKPAEAVSTAGAASFRVGASPNGIIASVIGELRATKTTRRSPLDNRRFRTVLLVMSAVPLAAVYLWRTLILPVLLG